MEKFRNKIIAISGEPVTGKGTNVKRIHKKLLEQGYEEGNIHLISTGVEFRKFFSIIEQFIKNMDNPDKLKELSETEQMQAIMNNRNYRAQFIETVGRMKQNGIEFSNFSIEDANNMPELADVRHIVDTLLDTRIAEIGEEIKKQDRPNEIWLVDSRLAFHNIPEAFSVRLTCRPDVAGARLMGDNTRGEEDKYESVQEAIVEREKRREGEIARYKERYGVDLADENNYDMIIDTSYSSVEDISSVILDGLNRYVEEKPVPKKWASPKIFLPTQNITDTWANFTNIEDVVKSIKENGYDMEREIKTIEVDGIKYVLDGHHRNFAAAMSGKTLLPYNEVAKDNGTISGSKLTAKDIVYGIRKVDLWDHEGVFDNKETGEQFSYNKIYPGIYEKIENKDLGESR